MTTATVNKIEIVVRRRRTGAVVDHQATVNCLMLWSVGVISRDGNWKAVGQYDSRDAAFEARARYAG